MRVTRNAVGRELSRAVHNAEVCFLTTVDDGVPNVVAIEHKWIWDQKVLLAAGPSFAGSPAVLTFGRDEPLASYQLEGKTAVYRDGEPYDAMISLLGEVGVDATPYAAILFEPHQMVEISAGAKPGDTSIPEMKDEAQRAPELPIVYSCSGYSSAAQMANYLALQLDKANVARMSCIAGVGGNVRALVKVATSGKQIIALDGCPLGCVKACLEKHGLTPTAEYDLSTFGVRKQRHVDFDAEDAARIQAEIMRDIAALPGE